MNGDFHPDDLKWNALRYVADELSADEAEAFESLLADCQEARDAVVCAVQLTSVIAAATTESSVSTVTPVTQSSRKPDGRRWALVAIATSCLVLISALAMRAWPPAGDPHANVVGSVNTDDDPMPNPSAGKLVSLWASVDASANGPDDVDDENNPTELQLAQNEENRELTVPDWLVIAVSKEGDDTSNPGSAEEIKSL